MTQSISLIVATDKKSGIGKDGDLPWHLKKDLQFFQKTTIGSPQNNKQNTIIMGRKTWDSLPLAFRPLKKRKNIVLTRQETIELPENVQYYRSLEQALNHLKNDTLTGDIFIIGGGELYKEAIKHPLCKTIYKTSIQTHVDCDTFFPNIPKQLIMTHESKIHTENNIKFTFQTFTKK